MDAVLQRVQVGWTKHSRGGSAASLRNAVPTAFTLPSMPSPFVHEVVMREHDGFQPQFTVQEGLADSGSDTEVLLREADGLLRVQVEVTPFGMPRRWRRPPAVRLARGEWLRWQINYRFASSHGGEWTYRLDTLNIAYGPTHTNLFLGTPTRLVSELAALR